MVYIAETDYEAFWGVVIDATSNPTSTQFATWITAATSVVNNVLGLSSGEYATDSSGVILKIMCQMLKRQWDYAEMLRNVDKSVTYPMMQQDPMSLTAVEYYEIKRISTGSDPDDAPAMTRAMHRGTNNAGYTLD
jgi:hypothetical protein